MPIQVLFIQGAGKSAHDVWDQKLAASLAAGLGDNYTVRFPDMPDEASPHFPAWKTAMRREFETMNDGDILVGHSVGGTMLLHALAEKAPTFDPGALVLLAAPFIGREGWPSDDIEPRSDFSKRLPPTMPVLLYHGTDDATVPCTHVHLYAAAIPRAVVATIPHGDHQFKNDLSKIARDIRALNNEESEL